MNLINLDHLRNKKNLLAFSGGTDSSALFHLLIRENISFDIAIVNYNTRETSLNETEYALELSKQYNLTCYTQSVNIVSKSNFEMNARNIRYVFFNSIIFEHHYDNLITGHNLNDKMEWFLMQMTRGAGIKELFGMEPISKKDILDTGRTYNIVRPLLSTPKDEILSYLEENKVKHFFDESNNDEKYTRNFFRKNYVEELVSEFSTGIKKTFDILETEVPFVHSEEVFLSGNKEYKVLSANEDNFVRISSSYLKKCGYVLSGGQRESLLKDKEIVYIFNGDRFVVSFFENKLYFSPYLSLILDKKFKEVMRKEKIPAKHRPYLFSIQFKG